MSVPFVLKAAGQGTVPIDPTQGDEARAKRRRSTVPIDERTVGVVSRRDDLVQEGYVLVSQGCETYLLDSDGRVVHVWHSKRKVFVAYLLPNGHLLRDGSDNEVATQFRAGGAAGWVEEVTWENEVVWSFSRLPNDAYLSHHDIEPMPNGNVLLLLWTRKSKAQAVAAGRNPELVPDGEVWDQILVEITPDGKGGADIVWEWDLWDHLIQDWDVAASNYGLVAEHPELFDINFCPPGGKTQARNKCIDDKAAMDRARATTGATLYDMHSGQTGEKDWIHANAVSYDAQRDQVVVSFNVHCEIIIIDHGTTTQEAKGHSGGRRGKGGDILFRWGNPQVSRKGSRMDQILFCQHSVRFTPQGTIILFNNGRVPDRHWSTVDEIALPEAEHGSGMYDSKVHGRELLKWTYGPRVGRFGSFYCTHSSGCRRMPNGNTLVTMGPQGLVFEVTPAGEEVWRWVSPVLDAGEHAVATIRQGGERVGGRFSMFVVQKYVKSFSAFEGRELIPLRYLEAGP